MKIYLPYKKVAILAAILATTLQANAQEEGVARSQGVADAKKQVNFMTTALLETYYKAAPKPIQFIGNKQARTIPEMDIDRTGKIVKDDPFGEVSNASKSSASGVASPGPIQNFKLLKI